ncbi:MAG: ACT domain-containing protein [Actinobacteria bacterium]|nr:ACT domain-containing protein [Actinomycetota bacterium]
METYVVRVWLPDRPGALGQVASRIGALRGDVIGIDILERGGGRAVDELVVALPDGSVIELLVAEMTQVDGVAVEDVRRVANGRPDSGLVALEMAAGLVEADGPERLTTLCHSLAELLDGGWVVALDDASERALVTVGSAPDSGWIAAFAHGSRHLEGVAHEAAAAEDLAWARLPAAEVTVAVGRANRPFHTRERQQMALLCRTADSLLAQSSSVAH